MVENTTTEKKLSPVQTEPLNTLGTQPVPPTIVDIINTIADRVDPLLRIVTTMGERMLKSQETEAHFRTRMAWVAVGIVTLIVAVAGGLTYVGKVDGSTFGFLLGLIVGYVLTFIRDAIKPPAEE